MQCYIHGYVSSCWVSPFTTHWPHDQYQFVLGLYRILALAPAQIQLFCKSSWNYGQVPGFWSIYCTVLYCTVLQSLQCKFDTFKGVSVNFVGIFWYKYVQFHDFWIWQVETPPCCFLHECLLQFYVQKTVLLEWFRKANDSIIIVYMLCSC